MSSTTLCVGTYVVCRGNNAKPVAAASPIRQKKKRVSGCRSAVQSVTSGSMYNGLY